MTKTLITRLLAIAIVLSLSLATANAQGLKGLGNTLKKAANTVQDKTKSATDNPAANVLNTEPQALKRLKERGEPPVVLTLGWSSSYQQQKFFDWVNKNVQENNIEFLQDSIRRFAEAMNKRMEEDSVLLSQIPEDYRFEHEVAAAKDEIDYGNLFKSYCEDQLRDYATFYVFGGRQVSKPVVVNGKNEYYWILNGLRTPIGSYEPFDKMKDFIDTYAIIMGENHEKIAYQRNARNMWMIVEKFTQANPSKLDMPSSKMNNASLNETMLKLVKGRFGNSGGAQPVKVVIVDSDWTIVRNPLGQITGRNINTNVVFKNEDGSYNLRDISYTQPYNGNNSYGATELFGVGLMNIPVNYQ